MLHRSCISITRYGVLSSTQFLVDVTQRCMRSSTQSSPIGIRLDIVQRNDFMSSHGLSDEDLSARFDPILLDKLKRKEPVLWLNSISNHSTADVALKLGSSDLQAAEQRWERLAPLLAKLFPEEVPDGRISSKLVPLKLDLGLGSAAKAFLKLDSELPVCASVKARGGLFEVFCRAEDVALKSGLMRCNDDRSIMATPALRDVLARESVAVGSTGNLGLSVGLAAAALGMRATVHMSVEAKDWKKKLLRSRGVEVVEHSGQYCEAVAAGRRAADGDPHCHFVDDETSETLFLGYSAAARELRDQLQDLNITVSPENPLVVFIPCGVGGAPGGICWGLQQYFGESVRVFFAEPVAAPCVLLGLASGLHDNVCGQDVGLDGVTEADGLAVSRPSGLACRMVERGLAGAFTVSDEELFEGLAALHDSDDGRFIEPSCCAGLLGPRRLRTDPEASKLLERGTLVFWATGGALVPQEERVGFLAKRQGSPPGPRLI